MNQTAALQGDAIYALLDQAHELLNDYNDDKPGSISRQDRIAAAVELMGQQNFAPATVQELERVHDFWLYLDQPEAANKLLQQHRDTALAAADELRLLHMTRFEARLRKLAGLTKDIVIVGIDGVKGAFEAMIAGKQAATVENPVDYAKPLIQVIRDYQAKKPIPPWVKLKNTVYPAEVAARELPNRLY